MLYLDYSTFSTITAVANLQVVYSETIATYDVFGISASLVIACLVPKDGGADQVDFETNWKPVANMPIAPLITTQYERNDKDLKTACDVGAVDSSTGQVTVNIKVPGVMANGDGRYVAGGTAFFDVADAGDKISAVNVIDIDNVLGYGSNFIVKTYTDIEQAAQCQGWFIPPKRGQVEVEPIGGYGFLPAQLYLQVVGQKVSTNKTGNFYMNIFWGKKE